MASSLDGMIGLDAFESDAQRQAYGFGGQTDHEILKHYLQNADAVVTGANSLRASRKTWEIENRHHKFADWIVLTHNGLDPDLEFFRQKNVKKYLISKSPLEGFHASTHCENLNYEEHNLGSYLKNLFANKNYQTVLLFGGGEINKLFYENNLVDYLSLTICPVILARTNGPRFVDEGLDKSILLSYESSQVSENLVFLKYKVKKNN